MRSSNNIVAGTFAGADIEPGTFHIFALPGNPCGVAQRVTDAASGHAPMQVGSAPTGTAARVWVPAPDGEKAKRYYGKVRARDVLLVLELGGAAHQMVIDYVRSYAADRARLAAANPGERELQEKAKNADEQLKREESSSSRLFVVDAGTELAALRARYPDRARYAIVGGRVRPTDDPGVLEATVDLVEGASPRP